MSDLIETLTGIVTLAALASLALAIGGGASLGQSVMLTLALSVFLAVVFVTGVALWAAIVWLIGAIDGAIRGR